ncbi:small ribosomal subunit protein mS23-like isoform X1 [Styela clava]
MASVGTRNHNIGSIYSRVKKLISSGVMKAENRPLWYDIYEAFPPKREPVFIHGPTPDEHGLIKQADNVKPLLYKEDWARASVNKLYGDFEAVHHLIERPKEMNLSLSFIKVFTELQKAHPSLSNEEIFEKTEDIIGVTRR